MEVVNNPAPVAANTDNGNGAGFLLGAVLLIIFAFLLFYYGIPAIRNQMAPAAPAPSGDTNINVPIPNKLDVNVEQKK